MPFSGVRRLIGNFRVTVPSTAAGTLAVESFLFRPRALDYRLLQSLIGCLRSAVRYFTCSASFNARCMDSSTFFLSGSRLVTLNQISFVNQVNPVE